MEKHAANNRLIKHWYIIHWNVEMATTSKQSGIQLVTFATGARCVRPQWNNIRLKGSHSARDEGNEEIPQLKKLLTFTKWKDHTTMEVKKHKERLEGLDLFGRSYKQWRLWQKWWWCTKRVRIMYYEIEKCSVWLDSFLPFVLITFQEKMQVAEKNIPNQ